MDSIGLTMPLLIRTAKALSLRIPWVSASQCSRGLRVESTGPARTARSCEPYRYRYHLTCCVLMMILLLPRLTREPSTHRHLVPRCSCFHSLGQLEAHHWHGHSAPARISAGFGLLFKPAIHLLSAATIDHGLPLFGVAHGFLYDYFPFLFRSHLQMPVFPKQLRAYSTHQLDGHDVGWQPHPARAHRSPSR